MPTLSALIMSSMWIAVSAVGIQPNHPQIEVPVPKNPSVYGKWIANLTDGDCAGKSGDCVSCIQDPACGWCADSQECVKGDCSEPGCGQPKPPNCEVYWKVLIPCGQKATVPKICALIGKDNQPVVDPDGLSSQPLAGWNAEAATTLLQEDAKLVKQK